VRKTRKEAFTKYFPSLSATGGGFRASNPMMEMDLPIGALLGEPDMPPVSFGMLEKGMIGAVMASQPVFAGGQIINGNRLAKIGVEAAELQKAMTEDEIALTVEQYYWQIVALDEKTKTITEAEKLLNRFHTDVKNAVEAGLANRNDLLKVELKQNELESGKLSLANGARLLKIVLAQFIGASPDFFEIDKSLIENVSPAFGATIDHHSALHQRIEYQLLDKNIEANELMVKMETGKLLPTVAVGAGWNYMSFDKGSPSAMKQDFGMVFAMVSVPITDWWGGSKAIKKQKIQTQIAQNDKRNAEEMLLIQMQQLRNEVEEAVLQVQLADKAIAAALENLRLNTDYYEAGTGLLTDLLDAQNALQQTRDQRTEAITAYCMKLARYRQATGN
jgi:outer membrane protein TolC